MRIVKRSLALDRILTYPRVRTSYKRKARNTEDYLNWLLKILKEAEPNLRPGREYNALCIRMNNHNVNEFLHNAMLPFDWLDIAPMVDDTLANDEYSINLAEVTCPGRNEQRQR